MKPLKLEKDYFSRDNRRLFLVGTNYMPSKAFYRMWEDWNPKQIEKDFQKMKELNLEAIRVPLFWSSVEPEEGAISPRFLERFDEFLRIAERYEILVMPFLFVGVCVDNWDVPWRKGRNIYQDPEMLKLEKKHVEALASKYGKNMTIFSWDISDEPYYYGGNTDADTATKWVSMLYRTIKSKDQTHPITLGFDNNHVTQNTGFQIERLAPIQDYFSVCAYPIYGLKTPEAHTSTRSTYFTSFFVKFSQFKKPALLSEGPGTTTVWTSPQRAGDYYRVVLYSSFINGSIGAMPWIFIDYDQKHHKEFPLDDKPFETSFGMLRSNGEEKPPAKELSKFAQIMKKIDLDRFQFRKPEAALLVPKDYYKYADQVWPRLFEAFILSKEAHFDVDFVREEEDLSAYRLLIVPSSLALRTSSCYALREHVMNGGSLYFSYGGAWIGSPSPLGPFFDETFGVSLQDRISPERSEEITFTKDWIKPDRLRLIYPNTDRASCIEVKAEGGRVVAFDRKRNPAVIVSRKGKGSAILVTHPIEQYVGNVPDAYLGDRTHLVYDALKTGAKLSQPFTCDSQFIEFGWMETKEKNEAIAVLANHERTRVLAAVSFSGTWQVNDIMNGKKVRTKIKVNTTHVRLAFEPSEVHLFSLKKLRR
jgi:beta-galactosidase